MITGGDKTGKLEPGLTCRQAKKQIRGQGSAGFAQATGEDGDLRLRAHLLRCSRCQAEARVSELYRVILSGDVGRAGMADTPDAAWFRGLRARIERGGSPKPPAPEDSFTGIVSLAARQMVPVLMALVLLIVGATLFWSSAPPPVTGSNDSVMMNQIIEYPQPTTDDVLGNLLAVEDKKNGK